MQKKFQFYQKRPNEKSLSQLSLRIQFSQIDSFCDQKLHIKQSRKNLSPVYIKSSSLKPIETLSSLVDLNLISENYQDRIERLQRQLQKLMLILHKQKQCMKQKISQLRFIELKREKQMKELKVKRNVLLENLRRQVKLRIKCNVKQRENYFQNLQTKFENQFSKIINSWKQSKKLWKYQIGNILAKYEGTSYFNTPQEQSHESQSKQLVGYYPSLSKLRQEIKLNMQTSLRQSTKFQQKLQILTKNFHQKRKEAVQKSNNNFLSLIKQILQLERTIKAQIDLQKLQAEDNRQKILLLFEEYVDKVNIKKRQSQNKHLNNQKITKQSYQKLEKNFNICID